MKLRFSNIGLILIICLASCSKPSKINELTILFSSSINNEAQIPSSIIQTFTDTKENIGEFIFNGKIIDFTSSMTYYKQFDSIETLEIFGKKEIPYRFIPNSKLRKLNLNSFIKLNKIDRFEIQNLINNKIIRDSGITILFPKELEKSVSRQINLNGTDTLSSTEINTSFEIKPNDTLLEIPSSILKKFEKVKSLNIKYFKIAIIEFQESETKITQKDINFTWTTKNFK
jgi:hypothetical protein